MPNFSAKIVALALATGLDEPIEPDSPLGKYLTEIIAAGLTEGVRAVLRGNPSWMSPPEIRNGLVRLGYDLSRYTNVLASIHTILGRLRKGGKVSNGIRKPGRETVYRWKGNITVEPQTANLKLETFSPDVRIRSRKPLPAWYMKITENGTKPLDFSKLTRGQKREAAELGIDDTEQNQSARER